MNGNRIYRLENCEVQLNEDAINTLKFWDERYPNILMDQKYLGKLAVEVFGIDCLANSSVYGMPARNANVQHAPLGEKKLKFVQGNKINSTRTVEGTNTLSVLCFQIYFSTVVVPTDYAKISSLES